MSEPFKIFICYAREDQEALEMLRKKLVPLQSDGQVQLWYDREITGGKDWDEAIRFNLKTADLVLLLISDDFFDSDYINQVEMKEALAGHTRQENIVVPVILYDCVWEAHREIARLQALPADAKPVFETQHWRTPADGFNNVVRGVLRILDEPDTEARRARKNTRLESLRQAEARATAEAERIAKEKKAAEKHRQEKAKAEAERLAAEKKEKEAAEARNKALPGMVPVKGGTFQMGEKGVAEPIHTVTLSDFEIGQFPVTQKLWQEMMGNNPANFKGEDLPVENVSWDDVQDFLKKLNARYPSHHYRLPTEAEWEFAARGGVKSQGFIYSGSNNLAEVGWNWENSGDKPLSGKWKSELVTKNNCRTHPVGRKNPNELGLYDMSGNVWEWCNDWYGAYQAPAQTNPIGPASGSFRVLRGGSWIAGAVYCRVSRRYYFTPEFRGGNVGFRLASSPQ